MFKKYSSFMWLMIGMVGMILLAFAVNQMIIFLPFVIGCIAICIQPPEKAFMQLLFFLPFSTVFKYDPYSISLFTIWEGVYLLRMVLRKGSLPMAKRTFICFALFFIFLLFNSLETNDIGAIMQVVTLMVPALACVYGTTGSENASYKDYALMFAIGVLLSALCGLLLYTDLLPNLKLYATAVLDSSGYSDEETMYRYYGLFGDPNVLAAYIMCSLAAVAVLFIKGKMTLKGWAAFSAMLAILGLLTVSKTFVLVLALLLLLVAGVTISQNDAKKIARLMGALIILILLAVIAYFLFDLQPVLEHYIERFSAADGSSDYMDALSSGRTSVWLRYLNEMLEGFRILTGYGIGGGRILMKAAHNTAIQMFYICGLIGVTLFAVWMGNWRRDIVIVHSINRKRKFDWQASIFPLVTLINLCSLDTFTWDFFYYILALMMISGVEEKNETSVDHTRLPLR